MKNLFVKKQILLEQKERYLGIALGVMGNFHKELRYNLTRDETVTNGAIDREENNDNRKWKQDQKPDS